MFREVTRKQKALSGAECLQVLQSETRGVLSVNGDDGYPYGMPMNHWYDARDGKLYFHCGKQSGHRLDALRKSDKVSFCVYDAGYREAGKWPLHVRSVIVFGRIALADDAARIRDITMRLSHKFTRDEAYIANEIDRHMDRTFLLMLTPEHMTGKLVEEA